MIIQCRKCNKKYDLDKSHLAKGSIKVRCPSCKHEWVVRAEFKKLETKQKVEKPITDQNKLDKTSIPTRPKLLPIDDLITLRTIVGYLGENSQFGWWDTNFLSQTGLQFLAINFPRSAFSAGCNSVTEAAKRLHDERIGKRGVYHLFRFPTYSEESVHKHLIGIDSEEFIPFINDKEAALSKLSGFVSNHENSSEGPVQIGTIKNIFSQKSIETLAMHYYDAFLNGKKCFPYFTVQS
jgi:predicted Zn finger-like uncharacterized protein